MQEDEQQQEATSAFHSRRMARAPIRDAAAAGWCPPQYWTTCVRGVRPQRTSARRMAHIQEVLVQTIRHPGQSTPPTQVRTVSRQALQLLRCHSALLRERRT